jgi:hypothetical protein
MLEKYDVERGLIRRVWSERVLSGNIFGIEEFWTWRVWIWRSVMLEKYDAE